MLLFFSLEEKIKIILVYGVILIIVSFIDLIIKKNKKEEKPL